MMLKEYLMVTETEKEINLTKNGQRQVYIENCIYDFEGIIPNIEVLEVKETANSIEILI